MASLPNTTAGTEPWDIIHIRDLAGDTIQGAFDGEPTCNQAWVIETSPAVNQHPFRARFSLDLGLYEVSYPTTTTVFSCPGLLTLEPVHDWSDAEHELIANMGPYDAAFQTSAQTWWLTHRSHFRAVASMATYNDFVESEGTHVPFTGDAKVRFETTSNFDVSCKATFILGALVSGSYRCDINLAAPNHDDVRVRAEVAGVSGLATPVGTWTIKVLADSFSG